MIPNTEKPFDQLERIFHEPKRLALMSELTGAPKGLTFSELKERCELTDGNLNRHLKVLDDAEAIEREKHGAGRGSRTVLRLTGQGRKNFLAYLDALEVALQAAAAKARVSPGNTRGSLSPGNATAKA